MTNSLLYNHSGRLERSDERNLPTWREQKQECECGAIAINNTDGQPMCGACSSKAFAENQAFNYETVITPLTL